jgi:hypothetical protein
VGEDHQATAVALIAIQGNRISQFPRAARRYGRSTGLLRDGRGRRTGEPRFRVKEATKAMLPFWHRWR